MDRIERAAQQLLVIRQALETKPETDEWDEKLLELCPKDMDACFNVKRASWSKAEIAGIKAARLRAKNRMSVPHPSSFLRDTCE
jgi:hypothetical protein